MTSGGPSPCVSLFCLFAYDLVPCASFSCPCSWLDRCWRACTCRPRQDKRRGILGGTCGVGEPGNLWGFGGKHRNRIVTMAVGSIAHTKQPGLWYCWHTAGVLLAYCWHTAGILLAYCWHTTILLYTVIQLSYCHTVVLPYCQTFILSYCHTSVMLP